MNKVSALASSERPAMLGPIHSAGREWVIRIPAISPETEASFRAETAAKARYRAWLTYRDVFPDLRLIDITAHAAKKLKPSKARRPVTDVERQCMEALGHVTMVPGIGTKRFVRQFPEIAEKGITESQARYLRQATFRYRRQIPQCVVDLIREDLKRDKEVANG